MTSFDTTEAIQGDDDLRNAIAELSGGQVVKTPPSGPVFARGRRRRRTAAATFVRALSGRDRLLVGALTVGWALSVFVFWRWWLAPAHRIGWPGLIVNSVLLAYMCLLPAYFLVAANRLRKVSPALAVSELRVAIVVTRAPSEPWTMVQGTLEAMLRQDYPHDYDVWLCDEAPTAEIRDWCGRNDVSISTREGRADYHRDTWPRRTRCKEGNLAYFYDTVGYERYDVVAQLDADHVPSPTYLVEMVRPFADAAVGYVAAPSVCDTNAAQSWSARGRLHREASFHGPVQLGHNDGLAPICIGSHYAVRTAALRSIGGIGPELAEDFSTSYLINVAGWSGAFAIDADARGEGPPTFGAMLTQEFQWSRSLAVVYLGLVSRTVWRLPWRLQLRFLFALSYYPLLVSSTAVGLLLPPVAAVTGLPWVRVNYFDFLIHWFALAVFLLLITAVLRRRRLLRPAYAPLISWEVWLYALARWPVIGWGLVAAVIQLVARRPVVFRVTPKGTGGVDPLPVRVIAPYAVLAAGLAAAALVGMATTGAVGYIGLCLIGAACYAVVAVSVPLLHAHEAAKTSAVTFGDAFRVVRTAWLVALFAALPALFALAAYPGYLMREFAL